MMSQADKDPYTLLIIDDDPNNIDILTLDLEDEHYAILTAKDGAEGWETLQANKDKVKVILLDRMMPNLNGMEFMAKLKDDPTVSRIPVIMQTAAAEREQIAQGIKAGVYYYLTKPYDQDVMLSVVRAAASDYADLSKIRSELDNYKAKLHMVKECYFEIATLADLRYLTTFLANFYPDSERVILGISELLLNAIEHGNLGLSYKDKTRLLTQNIWEEEITHIQQLPEHAHKRALVHYKRDETSITLNIKDEGKGFNWQEYLEISPDRATDPHGRGIALSRMMSFDSLEYKGCGNEVECKIFLKEAG